MIKSRSGLLLRSFWISLAAVAALLVAIWFGGRAWLAQSTMAYQGTSLVSGLQADVDILFDQRGIPRIYSQTDADALQALGWLHAGERLFQMELIRRAARGELAELFGPVALELDLFHRSFGFARRIEEERVPLDPSTRELVEAYIAGINAWIEQSERLPPEFSLLQSRPAPWRVEDVMIIAYYQSFYATTLVQRMSEAWREIVEHFGADAGHWLGELHDWTVSSVPAMRFSEGSNTWVVAPSRSTSGAALHAADPHLEYDIAPGMWYAAGLHSQQGLNVLGVTVPGLPFVAMGHNGQIAWAFTVAPVDMFEFWRQPLDPDDPDQVIGTNGPEAIIERRELVQVRDRETPFEQIYRFTSKGRILEHHDDHHVLVMQWAGFELPAMELLPSALAINRAQDFDSFRQAASRVGALSVNWSYSDRTGNIGYVQSTAIPRRRHNEPFAVLDATNPEHGWDGFYPVDQRPYALNPDQGWLGNANNHAAGADWPYPIPGFYKHLRMRRINSLLGGTESSLSRHDMHEFQLDRVSDRALSWKDWLADIAEQSGRDRIATELRQWDGSMNARSETAGLFARWWQYLPRALFNDTEHPDWRTMRVVLEEWLHNPFPQDMPDEHYQQAALTALDDALRIGAWPLGSFQTLTIRHPLAESGLLNHWLNLTRGPIPIGGDAASLNVTYSAFNPETATLRARAGASMRYVMDWSDPDSFTLNLTLGQSGNPFSPHFDDFLPDFIGGQPWIVPWTSEAVKARTHSQLRLTPDS